MTFTPFTLALAVYLVTINIVTYGTFARDKDLAVAGYRRVPEGRLLQLALFGGSVGAVLAQQLLRHKTRKQPFRARLILVILLQIVVCLIVTTILLATPSR